MHIVFHKDDASALAKSFGEEDMPEEKIWIIEEDFSLGPLPRDFLESGVAVRKEWDDRLMNGELEKENNPSEQTLKALEDLKQEMEEQPDSEVNIWIAPNARDVSGYYFLNRQLTDFSGRVGVLWLNNLPFINDKGQIFYPAFLSEIPPREFVKARKLARKITTSEFEMDGEEWGKMVKEGKMVRILDGGRKLTQKDADFFDGDLLKLCSGEWQKAPKLLHLFSKNNKILPAYAEWRLRELASGGQIELQSAPGSLKNLEIKLSGSAVAAEADTENQAHE